MSEDNLKSMIFLGCSSKNISPFVIMPATDFFKDQILRNVPEKPKKKGEVVTIRYGDKKISFINSGIGCPSTSLKLEALKSLELKALIRFDFCGSLTENVQIGDIVIANTAIAADGTCPHYWNFEEEKTLDCHESLLKQVIKKFDEFGIRYHLGSVYTMDALFKETPELIKKALNKNAIGIDMETSIIYTYGKLYDIPVLSIMIVSDQPFRSEKGFSIPKIDTKIFDSIQKVSKIILDLFREF